MQGLSRTFAKFVIGLVSGLPINSNNMKKKLLYEAPEADVLVVQTEAMICVSGTGGIDDASQDNWGELSAPAFPTLPGIEGLF